MKAGGIPMIWMLLLLTGIYFDETNSRNLKNAGDRWADWTPPVIPYGLPKSILFVHVPKTGGSTFGLALKRYIGAHFVKSLYINDTTNGCVPLDPKTRLPCANDLLSSRNKENCTLLIGCVLSHSPHLQFLQAPGIVSMTLLRKPVSRLVSALYHGYPHTGEKTRGCGRPPSCISLHGYMEMSQFQNVAVRMIGTNNKPYENRTIGEHEFELAKENLKKFDEIGLNEAFYTSVKLAFLRQGWTFKSKLIDPPTGTDCKYGQTQHCHDMANPNGKKKATKKRMDYQTFKAQVMNDTKTLERLKTINTYDERLWEHARLLFCQNLLGMKDIITKDDPKVVQELKSSNVCPNIISSS
eukprot:m.153039 g.153039  ORF g.153039 m.153039 type:complete len:354 (+) comp15063_c0_seq2:282-1343(+)